ncbi:MAG: glycine--tRNA ligase subunit beta [Candidatus Margulisiibacteriota bacterium]
MKNVLLEIGCEEIPARFMPGFLDDLMQKARLKLEAAQLTFSKIETIGTYRRLALYIENISDCQPDITTEVMGPPAEIAYKDGAPTGAAFGFAKKQGVDVNDLQSKEARGKQYIFAIVHRKGEATAKVLPQLLPDIITSMYMPLAMRWGDMDFKFIRPIHWILAMYGDRVVKFELAGIKSGNLSEGHRFIGAKGPGHQGIKVLMADLKEYKSKLLKAGVMVDPDVRRKKIEAEAKKISPDVLIEKDLLEEVNFLVEFPIAVMGTFEASFLKLPQDVLITSMKKNQKYFPTVKNKRLQEMFVITTDGSPRKYHKNIREGNQKVIGARLSDAKFFFDEDLKKPLKSRVEDLKNIEFFKGLGTMHDKVERLKKLSEYIARHLKIEDHRVGQAVRVSELCKADLLTQMVFEFPELQGIVGREYALAGGESEDVAAGIFEHYLPRHADDILPKTGPGMIVALADKIDSIVGCFSEGAAPSGSEDPYGIRRMAFGVVRIILENKLDILLDEVITASYKLYKKEPKELDNILEFMAQRMKPILNEAGVRHDVMDAALYNFNDVLDTYQKALVMMKVVKEPWFEGIVTTADRVGRIAKNAVRENVIEKDLAEPLEKELYQLYMKVNWEAQEKYDKGDFLGALKELARLTQPVHEFFEKVLVMHEDERIKTNRLALLKSINNTFLNFADLAKIVL